MSCRVVRVAQRREAVGAAMNDVGDEDLVGRVAGGDERALSELYHRYSRPMYTTGISLLGHDSLAEELVQDAFTYVWGGAGTFEPERTSFVTWLYRIARNRAMNVARKRRTRPLSVGEEPIRTVPATRNPRRTWAFGTWPGRSPASRRSTGSPGPSLLRRADTA